MPQTSAPSIEDELWEILDAHPEFKALPRPKQRWAFEQLWLQIIQASVDTPLSVEEATAKREALFEELGLTPVDEIVDTANETRSKLKSFIHSIDVFEAEEIRESRIDESVLNPKKLVDLQKAMYRSGWDEALIYAQNQLKESLGRDFFTKTP